MRVLIADDDPVTLRLLQVRVARLGHEVVAVADGDAALSILQEPEGPRIAILDWQLPGTDGLTICRQVRDQGGPYRYIILFTASNQREDVMAALGEEIDEFLNKPLKPDELWARLRTGQRILKLEDALRYQASHDVLTNLLNRRSILERTDHELARASREPGPVSFVMVDIDHFKLINDTHGHVVGDAVLRASGERLRSALRDSDAIGRYGGEEFLAVLPGVDLGGAAEIAERMRRAVEADPIQTSTAHVRATVSAGVATHRPGDAPGTAIQAADEALYRAKAAGRNQVVIAETSPELAH